MSTSFYAADRLIHTQQGNRPTPPLRSNVTLPGVDGPREYIVLVALSHEDGSIVLVKEVADA